MRLRSVAILLGLNAVPGLAQVGGRTIDEGTFSISVGAAATQTENFKIARGDNGLITATGQVFAGERQVTSSLTTDSVGTPAKYDLVVREKGALTMRVSAAGLAGRLTSTSSNQRGDESMHEYPLAAGRSLILDNEFVHQLYFVALSKRAGPVDVIVPRESHASKAVLTTKGLEPIVVAGRSMTATHYSLGEGAAHREFWVDGGGRLLRVEIPGRQLVAVREEPPK